MSLYIDRTTNVGLGDNFADGNVTVHVNETRYVTTDYGSATLAASSNTTAWNNIFSTNAGNFKRAFLMVAFSETTAAASNTSGGHHAVIVYVADSGTATVVSIYTPSGSVSLTAQGANVNINNTSTTQTRNFWWSVLGLI